MNPANPGFFGKLPQFGDFITRRLPRPFVETWDQWLQSAILASREQLGEQWLDIYLVSPLWRFALAPGVVAEDSAWAGIVMPSVDRVGRYFPFLIAAPVHPEICLTYLFDLAQPWFDEIEHLALSCLEDGFDLPTFDQRLERLILPDLPAIAGSGLNADISGQDGKYVLHLEIPQREPFSVASVGMAGCLLQRFLPRHSLWCSGGAQRLSASIVVCDGLPPIDAYAALMTGQWEQRGWTLHTHKVPEWRVQREAPSAQPQIPIQPQRAEPLWLSHGLSAVGRRRQHNEDALLEKPEIGLWAVADGMGGHQAGEVASQAIVGGLAQVHFGPDHGANVANVKTSLTRVNGELNALAEAQSNRVIIGSTVVALVASATRVSFLWAGDSRLYRLRAGVLEQLTTDHSVYPGTGADCADSGVFEWDFRNAITRAVGADTDLILEEGDCEVVAGDKFLLCSDGLDKELKANEIRAILDAGDAKTAAEVLIDNALERGARDNVTVIVVQINE